MRWSTAARTADLAAHATDAEDRQRARLLLDLLTPVAKSFPAEAGFEATALALQIHGGYGYSSELPPEAWLRDQKLNSLHEGTTGIQGLDLLGRKAVASGGAALHAFSDEVGRTLARARECELEINLPSGDTNAVPPMMSAQAPGAMLSNGHEGARETVGHLDPRPSTSLASSACIRQLPFLQDVSRPTACPAVNWRVGFRNSITRSLEIT